MGKDWDHQIISMDYWIQAFRICKPGSMLAIFGGTRTFHHTMLEIEGGGWIIRDTIMWLYGSGFPKSHNKFGLEGYGTALKPAYEPIILAMKPLEGTYKQNVEKWGIGGINIDGCRIEGNIPKTIQGQSRNQGEIYQNDQRTLKEFNPYEKGRWSANIILDEEAAAQLDEMTGILKSGKNCKRKKEHNSHALHHINTLDEEISYGDSGGASRFFYCAKASRNERNRGLEGLPEKQSNPNFGSGGFSRPTGQPERETKPTANFHPTVKPIALMKYIIKLLAPPNNPTLLDPFCGSGSTLLAAKELGINAIGIEKQPEYCEIARARLNGMD